MNATRTEPRVHCFKRQINGDYVHSSGSTTQHLRAVFEAERQRIALEKKPRRKRRLIAASPNPQQNQLQLVA